MSTDSIPRLVEPIDKYVVEQLTRWATTSGAANAAPTGLVSAMVQPATVLKYFDAQLQSRHLDFAAKWLQSKGEGFYTIGSNGHESNAAVAMALRPTDPALLHYRSGGFYAARASQVPGLSPIRDVLLSMMAGREDPISGGRHKVFGHPALGIIPQTSTIGSHLPRAFGLAYSLANRPKNVESVWPADAVVVTSFGDASLNHSTVMGALNAIDYCSRRDISIPLLLVCEDNGYGISTRTPDGWVSAALGRYGSIGYAEADGTDPIDALTTAHRAAETVRRTRRPVALRLTTTRFGGHAGSDAEISYRSSSEIAADYPHDPLLATAHLLWRSGELSPQELLERYELMRTTVMVQAEELIGTARLSTAIDVMAPLHRHDAERVAAVAQQTPPAETRQGRLLPEGQGPLTLAQSINAALGDALATWPQATIFGEDVARKGGVYGVTRTLARRFGSDRVFDTILDEQTILGTALGSALDGILPIPEIQYLAYVHNAEDQLRGEAATLAFFSNNQFRNGMVVRIAGLSYQKGFGGHFHNDNSIAALRDIPGVVIAVPSHPAEAPALLRTCLAMAQVDGRVCVFLEPIALYHRRDLEAAGDEKWTAPYRPPTDWAADTVRFGEVGLTDGGNDVLIVTFGNGVPMSLNAASTLSREGIGVSVLDLRWLAPLPIEALLSAAQRFPTVLIADETRATGGVGEGIVAALVAGNYRGAIRRVSSLDTVIPLGPAADVVLLDQEAITSAARDLHLETRPSTPEENQ